MILILRRIGGRQDHEGQPINVDDADASLSQPSNTSSGYDAGGSSLQSLSTLFESNEGEDPPDPNEDPPPTTEIPPAGGTRQYAKFLYVILCWYTHHNIGRNTFENIIQLLRLILDDEVPWLRQCPFSAKKVFDSVGECFLLDPTRCVMGYSITRARRCSLR